MFFKSFFYLKNRLSDINFTIDIICYFINKAALDISNKQNKKVQTVRKRINEVLLHKPEQKAYGYSWKMGNN